MSRYYLISQLPALSMDQPPHITAETFLLSCREQLGPADAGAAEALMTGGPSAHAFVTAWRNKDTLIRNAVAKARARAASTDATQWLHPTQEDDSQIERLVEDAFELPNPLRQERALDKTRWAVAESLQGLDPMDVKVVLAYAVKLSIALRWAALDTKRGQEVFDALTQLPEGQITL